MTIDLALPNSVFRDQAIPECDDISSRINLYLHAAITNPDIVLAISKLFSHDPGNDGIDVDPLPIDIYHDFIGRPINDALEHHQEAIRTKSDLNTNRFICVVDDDWERCGALVVGIGEATQNEENDREEGKVEVQKMRVPPRDLWSFLINRTIGNIDWEEYEAQFEGRWHGHAWAPEKPGPGVGDADEGLKEMPSDEPWLHEQTDEAYSDGSSSAPLYNEYYVALYAIPEVDFTKAIVALDPAFGPKKPLSQRICRPAGRVPKGSRSEVLAEAARLHPMRYRNNILLHKTLFFIIDSLSYERDGILLVKLDWGTSRATKSLTELASLGSSAAIDSQRVQFSAGDSLTRLNSIHMGYRPWKYNHKTFIAYAGPTNKRAENYIKALDKSFDRRMEGTERFICAETDLGDDAEQVKEHLNAAVRGHWDDTGKSDKFIRETKFLETLHREYFVFSNERLTSKKIDEEKMVLIVKPDGPEEDGGKATDCTTLQCPAGEAYSLLCSLVEGTIEWHGQTQDLSNL